MRVVSLTGFAGGKLKPMSDFNLNVNSNNMQVIEDVFSVFGHAVYSTLLSKL
jgi:phosphoheptose isomerase